MRTLLLCFAGLLMPGFLLAQSASSPRPAYQFLRWKEDWSGMKDASRNDAFDAIKYVSLGGDGSAWASFGGDFRVRAEAWNNFGFGEANDDTFVLSRFRAHGDIHPSESWRLFGEIKGAYSSDRDLPGGVRAIDEDKFELQQLFVESEVTPGVKVRVGRQLFAFGAQRLISGLPWANALRTWDGVRVDAQVDDWTLTAFGAAFVPPKDGIGEADTNNRIGGVYAHRAPEESRPGTEVYALRNQWPLRSFNGTTGRDARWSLGSRIWGTLPGSTATDYQVEVTHQFGSTGAGSVNAWSVASQLGHKLDASSSLRLWVGFDWASGDDSPGGSVQTFNQLYPLGHAYFGITDVIGRQNIIDVSAGASWKPFPDMTLNVGLHQFHAESTRDAIYNPGGGVVRPGNSYTSSQIGHEFDLTAGWKLTSHLSMQAGYGHFFAGDALRESGSSADVDFTYVGASFTY